ncbi:hypothetical protein AAZV13_02G261700 [Glycine max]
MSQRKKKCTHLVVYRVVLKRPKACPCLAFGLLILVLDFCFLSQSPQVCSEVLVGLRGFIQSPRPIQQGPALNVGFSVTAFHESISA